MTRSRLTIITITLLTLSAYGSLSNAEEMVLCMNPIDQYIVALEQGGNCLEEEDEMKIAGSSLDDIKNLTPVAVFEDNDKCETQGSVIKFGFDKNDNYKLDDDEIMSISRNCKLAVDEDSSQ